MEVRVFKRTVSFVDVPGECILYKNFAGRDPKGYNQNHERMFDIELSEQDAKLLYDLGWRVKVYGIDPNTGKRPKNPEFYDELENKTYRVTVKVSFKYPTDVWRIVEGSNKKVKLYPDVKDRGHNISILDGDNIISADIDCRGSVNPNDGIISLYNDVSHFVVANSRSAEKYSSFEADDYEAIPQEEFDGEAPWEKR